MQKLRPDDIKDNDILILVVGQTGSGKSKFINTAAGKEVRKINDDLDTCDLKIQPVVCPSRPHTPVLEPPYRVIFVETPGMNSGIVEDSKIAKDISQWIARWTKKEIDLGIIFLVRSGQPRCPPLDNLRNNEAIRSIALSIGTAFTDVGAPPRRDRDHDDTYASAWEIVDLIRSQSSLYAPGILKIQEAFRRELGYESIRYKTADEVSIWKALVSLFGTKIKL